MKRINNSNGIQWNRIKTWEALQKQQQSNNDDDDDECDENMAKWKKQQQQEIRRKKKSRIAYWTMLYAYSNLSQYENLLQQHFVFERIHTVYNSIVYKIYTYKIWGYALNFGKLVTSDYVYICMCHPLCECASRYKTSMRSFVVLMSENRDSVCVQLCVTFISSFVLFFN